MGRNGQPFSGYFLREFQEIVHGTPRNHSLFFLADLRLGVDGQAAHACGWRKANRRRTSKKRQTTLSAAAPIGSNFAFHP
jgi:hypothetical protein